MHMYSLDYFEYIVPENVWQWILAQQWFCYLNRDFNWNFVKTIYMRNNKLIIEAKYKHISANHLYYKHLQGGYN